MYLFFNAAAVLSGNHHRFIRSIGYCSARIKIIIFAVAESGRVWPVSLFERLTKPVIRVVVPESDIASRQKEIDHFYMLLAYALVYKHWQPGHIPRSERRGYNIGALLVDPQNDPVFYGLNCIDSTDNATQHGEVRAITGYIEKKKCFNLDGFTMYTTLEPCIMCAGMMTMTVVKRVVYGQHDVGYSKAFERLSADTSLMGGFPPYPRQVLHQASTVPFTDKLDQAYALYLETAPEKILALFLGSETANRIYLDAYNDFLTYAVQCPENELLYHQATRFLQTSMYEHTQQS